QFLVLVYDGTDVEASARRQAARPAHLDRLKGNVASGRLVFGGPIFDDGQKPIGSFLLADCASRQELDSMIANDPYTKGNVWQRVEVKPVRLVVQDGTITP
ncbi:MAG: YciI family protein, partial [Nevskiales bacterium]